METLYRKVAVSEQNPTKSGEYFTNEGLVFYASTYNGFEHNTDPHRVYPDWWLEEIPDPTAQLKADKEEMLSMLEEMYSKYEKDGHLLNVSPSKIESLIQKMKQ